jgi:hypothetical protein
MTNLLKIFLVLLFSTKLLFAQQGVAINTDNSNPDGSAILDGSIQVINATFSQLLEIVCERPHLEIENQIFFVVYCLIYLVLFLPLLL